MGVDPSGESWWIHVVDPGGSMWWITVLDNGGSTCLIQVDPHGGSRWFSDLDPGGSTSIVNSGGSRLWILLDLGAGFGGSLRWILVYPICGSWWIKMADLCGS